LPNTKFVFPTGARKETTVFGGKETNSWFDIHTFSDRTVGEKDQIPGLSESISYLSTLIKEQVEELIKVGVERGEARKRIVVGGFSSGAALAVLGRLSGEWEIGGGIGGFVGMSGWLPFRAQIDQLPSEVAGGEGRKGKVRGYLRELLSLDGEGKESEVEKVERGERMKVLLCHGEKDVKVKYEWALQMRKTLEGIGAKVQWRSYEGLEHWVCGEEMSDVVAFLRQV
jgi:predicted esterase